MMATFSRNLTSAALDSRLMERVSRPGLIARTGATAVMAVLLTAGTLWGSDDHFPFGPFKMYSTARDLNTPVGDTRVYGTDATGAEFLLKQEMTGLRRAEFEGQLPRFREHPELLSLVAEAYAIRNPDRPELEEITILVRRIEIEDGIPTGVILEERVEVTWTR